MMYFCLFQDLRRNQRRIAELNSTIRKLEDRNTLLVDERNELVKTNLFVLSLLFISFFSSKVPDAVSCNPPFSYQFLFNASPCLFLYQLKRVRESEKQCKPLLDKNKLLGKRNDDLTMTIQKLEEKLKSLAKENLEMVSRCHILFVYMFYPLQRDRLICEQML